MVARDWVVVVVAVVVVLVVAVGARAIEAGNAVTRIYHVYYY